MTTGNILLVGDTGAGKTTQIGRVAEAVMAETGRKTLLYTADRGGTDPIAHLIRLGVIDVEPLSGDPFVWLHHAAQGERLQHDRWVPAGDYGVWAYESFTSLGEELLERLRQQHADGRVIGLQKSAFRVDLGDGFRLAANTEAHFGIVQSVLRAAAWRSQQLPGLVIWTAAIRRAETQTGAPVLGPMLVGDALTPLVPRWFRWTFRLQAVPEPGKPPRHQLLLQAHVDGLLTALANARLPLGSDMPAVIEPADVWQALQLIAAEQQAAEARARARLQL